MIRIHSYLHRQKMLWVFALTLLTPCLQQARAANGGLKIRLAQKGLEYGKEFGLQMLTSMLMKERIEDISGSYSFPLYGIVHYSVSGIQIKHLHVNHSTVAFVEGKGLSLNIQNAEFMLSGTWNLSTRHETGTVDISIKQLSLFTLLGLDRDDRGRPDVWYADCHSSIGDLDVTFHGQSSWLYNIFAIGLKGMLRSEVNKELCAEVERGIYELAHSLRTMRVSTQIDSLAAIDYSLVNKPDVGVDRCDVDLRGEFFPVRKFFVHALLPVPPFHLPNQSDSMLLLAISDFILNSAASVYFKAGALWVNITDNMIPKGVHFRLHTKNMGMLIPELKMHFPDMAMEVLLAARKQPVFSFHPGSLDTTIFGSAEFFVVLPNARRVSVFLLNVYISLTGQVYLEEVKSENSLGKVGGSLAMKKFHLELEKSNIGDIKVMHLEKLLKLFSPLALSKVNRNLKRGVILPSIGGASVMNPKVTMHEGYMQIATDLHLQLPPTSTSRPSTEESPSTTDTWVVID
ncbi:bactericidal permeability-increasing protein-like [Sceloporus undulatus]|uniref:bactericidal permeability-increasing protein-like n=1 Tax=Sceloporus undulatus TaxID=8520 RepID=UPI001C4D7192|nr:bactericidal permeability-increasing protein-like [Sceloporus undulatus]